MDIKSIEWGNSNQEEGQDWSKNNDDKDNNEKIKDNTNKKNS